jgi:acetyltransferase-like isoleucine patch superfamily enzyme
MVGIRSSIKKAVYKSWLAFFKATHPNVRFAGSLMLHGLPLFSVRNDSIVEFGAHVVLTSSKRMNMVGLSKRCSIYVGSKAKLQIGDCCGFSGVSIYCTNEIVIGNYLTCGGNVCIWDTDFHSLDYLARRPQSKKPKSASAPVVIGDDVFIGANAMILKGVTIGSRSIVGAGSVVTKSIPADQIWAGNPATFIRCVNP